MSRDTLVNPLWASPMCCSVTLSPLSVTYYLNGPYHFECICVAWWGVVCVIAINNDNFHEIRSQFHQHLTRAFFVRKQIEQLFSSYVRLCNFWRQNFVQKLARKMLMKLTPGQNLVD
jgi:hypothetical protein